MDLTSQRMDAIRELLQHIEPAYRHRCRAMLRGEAFSFSQAWQDWYLFQNFFYDRLTWGDGVYVDIGANQPTVISNTLFFDKCLGWRGVLFEPQAKYHRHLRQERNATLVPECVVGRREARLGHKMQGMHLRRGGTEHCADASTVLPAILGHGVHIDLLSIDIEGVEPSVLRCFPFDRLGVRAVLIETNQAEAREVDLFFHRHDFVNEETFIGGNDQKGTVGWLDNLYVRRTRKARYPPTSYACNGGARAHRLAWCTPWLPWYEGQNVPRQSVDSSAKFGPCPQGG